jgi:hypothetical protein
MKRYYLINYFVSPEVIEVYKEYLSTYAKDIIKQVVNAKPKELNTIYKEVVSSFYRNTKRKTTYVDKETYEIWISIPRPKRYMCIFLLINNLKKSLRSRTMTDRTIKEYSKILANLPFRHP